jgi:hypothetical protein
VPSPSTFERLLPPSAPPPFLLPRPAKRGEGRGEGRAHCPPRILLLLTALLATFSLACSTTKWTVKPHQREYLADRIMQLDGNSQERAADQHVLSNREGAVGASGTAGGGCGCN